MLTLGDLHIGQDAIIRVVGGEGELRHHLLDMGLTPGTEVTLRKTAPMGDPIEVELRGYELTLRLADAQKIEIDSVHATDRAAPSEERHKVVAHPGVGELDKAASYHERKAGAPIAAGAPLTFALAGNQNCGKTTLFNQLTGSNQHVGNFPGVTVDRKDGVIRNHKEATVTDLPGIYSLSPYSNEEIVTRDFILSEPPSGIINIVDASNIERNLYLTMQLMELDTPMVLALNMMDIVEKRGMEIDMHRLPEMLGVPAIPVSARKKTGLSILMHAVAHHSEYQSQGPFIHHHEGMQSTHRHNHHEEYAMVYEDYIEDKIDLIIQALAKAYPDLANKRWHAIKLLEGDKNVAQAYPADLSGIIDRSYEKDIINQKYDFIEEVIREVLVNKSQKEASTEKIDRYLTSRWLGLPIFLCIMLLIFWLTFGPGLLLHLHHRRLAEGIF